MTAILNRFFMVYISIGLYFRLLNFQNKSIAVGFIPRKSIFLHRFGAPGIVSTHTVNIQIDVQVDEIMKFDSRAFESFKKALSKISKPIKVASSNPALQVGVNAEETNSVDSQVSLTDQLKGMFK